MERFGAGGDGEVAALARNFWTPEEDDRLRMLVEAGKQIEFVAAELKRSAKAVKGRAYILRISLKRVNLKPKAKGK
jgi:sulfur transfer protein SufE